MSEQKATRRQPWFSVLFALLLVLMAFLPIVLTMLAAFVASVNGCRLDEAGYYPCVIAGHDFSHLLGNLGMTFWYAFFSMPAALALAFVWLLVMALIHGLRRYKKSRPEV